MAPDAAEILPARNGPTLRQTRPERRRSLEEDCALSGVAASRAANSSRGGARIADPLRETVRMYRADRVSAASLTEGAQTQRPPGKPAAVCITRVRESNQVIERLDHTAYAARHGIEQLSEIAEQASHGARSLARDRRSGHVDLGDQRVHVDGSEIERHDIALARTGTGDAHCAAEVLRHDISAECATGELKHAIRLQADDLADGVFDQSEARNHGLIDGDVAQASNQRQGETGDAIEDQTGALDFLCSDGARGGSGVRCYGRFGACEPEGKRQSERRDARINNNCSLSSGGK